MDANFMQQMRESHWASLCHSTESHLEMMSTGWSQEAYELVREKVRSFVSQPPPQSKDELHERFMEKLGLSSILGSVSHVEAMIGKYDDRKDERLRLVKMACSLGLPRNKDEAGQLHLALIAVSMQLSSVSSVSSR